MQPPSRPSRQSDSSRSPSGGLWSREKRSGRRIAAASDQLMPRQKDSESRTATLEVKVTQASTKEQALATELQRADNLMEDLTKKEHDLRARDEAAKASEKSLTAREATLVARDAEVRDGMRSLEKLRKEIDDQRGAAEEDRRTAKTTREEAESTKRDADKIRAQADEMQAEVNKNLRFLQKKALDVLDQEEKIRARVATIERQEKSLDTRGEILEGKERALEADQTALDAKIGKLQAEADRLRARLTDTEKSGGRTSPSVIPLVARSDSVRGPWVMDAGCCTRVSVPPRLTASVATFTDSTNRRPARWPPFSSKLSIAPKPDICLRARACCGNDLRPG